MSARLRYPELAPDGYAALSAFGHYVNAATSLDPVLLGLVYLRASVLNGCHFCIEAHKAELRKHHEPDSRIDAIVSGPDPQAFTPRELAALRWTEVLTHLNDQQVTDEQYDEVSVFFRGKDLVDLSFAVANINAWNRMGMAFQPTWRPRLAPTAPRVTGNSESAAAQPTSELTPTPDAQHVAVVDDDGGKVATG